MHDAGSKLGTDPVTNSRGRSRAHVSPHQNGEQFAQKIFINQPAFALEQIANVGVQQVMRFLERRAKLAEPALLRRGFWRGSRRTPLPGPGRRLLRRFIRLLFESIE